MAQKILVVDDDRSVLTVVKKYFIKNGYSVVMTDNGSEALLLVRDSKPDLILTDVDMPGLDGHAVCRVLKKEATSRSIPIIIMSGSRIDDKDILSGFEGGADDYVVKPFVLPILKARIEAVLGVTRRPPRWKVAKRPASSLIRRPGRLGSVASQFL